MASKTPVSGSVVRTWAQSEEGQAFLASWAAEKDAEVPTVGLRGKFSAELLDAFHKANRRSRYTVGHVAPIKIKGSRPNSKGGTTPVQVSATLAEVRAFAKAEGLAVGERGRVSAEVLTAFASRPKA